MKQAIMIGAGNIGRGFIGALLEKSGYHVTFADVAENLITAINERKSYTVHIQDRECAEWTVTNISGISSAGPELAEAIAGDCQLITTAVGLRILPIVAKPIAAGIQARKAAGSTQILNVVACENAIRGTSQLRDAVYSNLSEEELAYAKEYVGFADCAVDRIVPKASFENPLDVAVEQYTEWDVEKGGWKGQRPEIEGLGWVDDLDAYLERKLFTLNSGHAICAYLGALRGIRPSWRASLTPPSARWSTRPCGRAARASSKSSASTPKPTTPILSASLPGSRTPSWRTRLPGWPGSPSASWPPPTG